MKNLKKMCNKVVATTATTLTAMALVGALGVSDVKSVYAAENELTFNESMNVVLDSGDAVDLSFTAPEDGTYYFYSSDSGYADMYATLTTEEEFYENDDNEYLYTYDFLIEAELTAGEVCTLSVQELDGMPFDTMVTVADKETADKNVGLISEETVFGISVGSSVEFNAKVVSMIGTEIATLPEGYSVSWSMDYFDDITPSVELDGTGLTYAIDSVTEDMLCNAANGNPSFGITLYKGEEAVNTVYFSLFDENAIFDVEYYNETAGKVGEEITLTNIAYDFNYNEIDLSDADKYYFEWYRCEESEDYYSDSLPTPEYIEGDKKDLTITLTEDDFYNDSAKYYMCDIYENGAYAGTNYFYIINNDTYIEGAVLEWAVHTGDSVELVPEFYDYFGDKKELDTDKYYVEWHKYSADLETYEETDIILGISDTYNIDSIVNDDIYSPERGYYNVYYCVVYPNDSEEAVAICEIALFDYDYYYYGMDGEFFVEVGDSVEMIAKAMDFYGEDADITGDEFTYDWYRVSYEDLMNGEMNIEPLGTDMAYVIDSVTEDMWNYEYFCDIYKNGEYVTYCAFTVKDIKTKVEIVTGEYSASIGDTLTMEVKLLDYLGNEIDIEETGHIVEWGQHIGGGWYFYVGDGLSYTINKVTESDFTVFDPHVGMEIAPYVVSVYDADYNYITEVEINITEIVKEVETTTEAPETTTKAPETTTVAPTTKAPETTTVAPTTAAQEIKAPAKAKVKKVAAKKKASKTVKVTLKKVAGADGYQVQVSKAKKFKNKNILVKKDAKKLKVTLKNKKLKNKNKLYVRARAYAVDANGKKVYGVWSKAKKVRIK